MRYVASGGSVLYHIAREAGREAPSLCGWRPRQGWERIHSAEVRHDRGLEEAGGGPSTLLVCERCYAAYRRVMELEEGPQEERRSIRLTPEEAGVLEGAAQWVLSAPGRRQIALSAGKVMVLESAVENLRRQHVENQKA